jgi:purine-binding chemotaxis protein CheW
MSTDQASTLQHTEKSARGGKYLTFFLAGEEYGVEILRVHEIIGAMPITRVPRTPAYIRGVINLRGKVIPIMDLRLKFGMEATEQAAETCIIVVQVHGVQTGAVVDRVSEVADIATGDIEDAPAFGADINTAYLLGIAKCGGQVKLLLDIERVLSTSETIAMQSIIDARDAAA